MQRDCPEEQVRVCFECNEEGHFARDCPGKADNNSQRKCYRCNKPGHLARDCTEEVEEGEEGGGGNAPDDQCYQ